MDIKQPKKRRNANYKLLDAFKDFENAPVESVSGTCGNIQNVLFSRTNVKGELDLDIPAFYDLVSAPMLLARLVSAGFIPNVEGQDGYKVTWTIVLKHKKTGYIVTFYDYKGASSIGTCGGALHNKKFHATLRKLVKALTDNRFPHPYDGCVVGEVA